MIDELAVAHVLLAAVALISCLSVPHKRAIRTLPRAPWVMVIVLVPLAGPVGWFLAGRPHRISPPRTRWQDLLGRSGPPAPPAPEDDPEFLRSLEPPGTGRPPSPEPPHPPDPAGEDVRRREDE